MLPPDRHDVHVAIDGFHLWGSSRDRGIGTYVRGMLAALAPRDDVRVTITVPAEVEGEVVEGDVTVPEGIRAVRVTPRRSGPLGFIEHARRSGEEFAALGVDLAHVPGLPPPARPTVPTAVTVHDLFPLTLRWTANSRERNLLRLSLPLLRRTDAIVVPSEHTAAELRARGFDPARLHVVPNGVDPAFHPAGEVQASDRPYVLMVAGPDRRKRRELSLDVIEGVVAAGLPHRLVLVGRQTDEQEAHLRELVAARGLGDHVEVAGHVDDLAAWYRGAAVVLVTSAGEGFGYPAVEAMACGAPVVALANSATTEIVGQAGVLVGGDDVAALTRATVDLLADDDTRARLVVAGRERARAYDLDTFGQGLVDCWTALLARSPR